MERCTACGTLVLASERETTCPECGGRLAALQIQITRDVPLPPTGGEELTERLLGIGA